jgi:hypothetical protein
MTFKENIKRKIEQNCVKSELKGEVVYLKKSKMPIIGDWSRIYPPINEDDKINWVNLIFGGKRNLIKLLVMIGVVALFFLAYREIASQYTLLRNLPCVQNCFPQMNYTILVKP